MNGLDDYSYSVGYERAVNAMFKHQVSILCDLIVDYPHLWVYGDGYGGHVKSVIETMFRDYGFAESEPEPRVVINRRPISKTMLISVMLKSGSACVACGSDQALHVDHIVPHSRGGSNDIENLQMLCARCNLAKGAKTMQEWQGDAE